MILRGDRAREIAQPDHRPRGNGKRRGKADEIWAFNPVNFAEVARSFGCAGLRVDRPQELADALNGALKMGRPVVIDVATDPLALARPPWTPASG